MGLFPVNDSDLPNMANDYIMIVSHYSAILLIILQLHNVKGSIVYFYVCRLSKTYYEVCVYRDMGDPPPFPSPHWRWDVPTTWRVNEKYDMKI